MTTDLPPPPPFYCPACGKKHRADLSILEGKAGAQAKVTCARCEAVMTLFLGEDGLPKCALREVPTAEPTTDSVSSPPAAQVPVSTSGGSMSKSSLPLQLAAAAILAAVVSFGVVSATKSEPAAPSPAAKSEELAGLLEKVSGLERRLAQAESEARAAKEELGRVQELRAAVESNATGLNAQGQTVSRIEQLQTSTNESVKKIQSDYKSLNGRIERNYNNVRKLDKRVKTLEGA